MSHGQISTVTSKDIGKLGFDSWAIVNEKLKLGLAQVQEWERKSRSVDWGGPADVRKGSAEMGSKLLGAMC